MNEYHRGYQAGYRKRMRELTPTQPRAAVGKDPVKEKAYQDCKAAVEECHRLEAKFGLPMWAEYYDTATHQIREIPKSDWPAPYVEARTKWDELRTVRDYLYTQPPAPADARAANTEGEGT